MATVRERDTVDRYLKIIGWLRKRHNVDGWLTTWVGIAPTLYTVRERAAWDRYMKNLSLAED